MTRLPIPFNNPRTYVGHSGVDFAQPRGTVVRASGPGVIGNRSTNARGGLIQWVDYDGMPGVGYAHLDTFDGIPPKGTRVVEGTPICRVGNSGFSTGPHLHMEVNGHATTAGFWRYFDPDRVVGQGSAAGGGGRPIEEDDMYSESDRARDVKVAEQTAGIDAKVTEIRQILYDAGLQQASQNAASTDAKVTEIRQILYDANLNGGDA